MRIPVVVVALVLAGGVAEAAAVPLPRPRPPAVQLTARAPVIPLPRPRPSAAAIEQAASAPATEQEGSPAKSGEEGKPGEEAKTAEAPPQPSPCQIALRTLAAFTPEPPVKGAGQCGIDDPVRLEAVVLPGQARVAINPPAVLRCDMATAISNWIRDHMAPVAARLGSPLSGIENFDSYDCRGRNRVFGAKMSEHGRGNALDIKAVKLESGVTAHLTDPHVAKAVRTDLRQGACDRFMTVLGPGSDGYHEHHIHVDLAERRSDFRMCQWEVRLPLDRASPSPHIAESRSPTPLEVMTVDVAASATERPPASTPPPPPPRPRRAAERR